MAPGTGAGFTRHRFDNGESCVQIPFRSRGRRFARGWRGPGYGHWCHCLALAKLGLVTVAADERGEGTSKEGASTAGRSLVHVCVGGKDEAQSRLQGRVRCWGGEGRREVARHHADGESRWSERDLRPSSKLPALRTAPCLRAAFSSLPFACSAYAAQATPRRTCGCRRVCARNCARLSSQPFRSLFEAFSKPFPTPFRSLCEAFSKPLRSLFEAFS
eukprot:5451907-Pleurochrysis_carterae.AAC.2